MTVENNSTCYTSNTAYWRSGTVGRCILLGAEKYIGWVNSLADITISGNSLTNCGGIVYYNPTNTQAVNVFIANNVFSAIRGATVNVPGAVVASGVTATAGKATVTPTSTSTPVFTPVFTPVVPTPTISGECLEFPLHKETICIY